jgi:enterochelin esterase-like enzyme
MLRSCLFALACFGTAFPAVAQGRSASEQILSETMHVSLPGPGEGETRDVFFWRPPDTPEGRLPVIYVADGFSGLEATVELIRPAILEGRARPIVVVGMAANPDFRTREYALGRRANPLWESHFAWVTDTVIPWAEIHAGASTERSQRAVGGMSNGADFAIAAASRRPDLFGAVLAHSPVNELRSWFHSEPDTRWVLTAGNMEDGGQIAQLSSRIAIAIGNNPVRQCIGSWGHDLRGWRNVSPGSIAWMFDFPEPDSVATARERENCHVRHDG